MAYESLKSMKGQIVADFIVEHRIGQHDLDVGYLTFIPWKLYFDKLGCKDGKCIGVMLVSSHDEYFEFTNRLEYICTNNQVEYEALLFGQRC